MIDDYEYHLFMSYSRSGDVPEWLYNHFLPVLRNRLDAVLPEEPQLFIDKDIEKGSDWPETLSNALHRSCYLLAILTPRYFRSEWCLAEWQTMRARENQIKTTTKNNVPRLIYPIVFSDGEHFPEEAKRMQWRTEMHQYAYPYPQFRKTERYLVFHDVVGEIADELAKKLKLAPPWNSKWESMTPDSKLSLIPKFPRF